MLNVLFTPVEKIQEIKKTGGYGLGYSLLLVSALIVFIISFLSLAMPKLKYGSLTTDAAVVAITGSAILAVALAVGILFFSFLLKITAGNLGGKSSFLKALAATTIPFFISIFGFLAYFVLGLLFQWITSAQSDYNIRAFLAIVFLAINLAILLVFLVIAMSSFIRATLEFFEVDSARVLLIGAVIWAAMVIAIYIVVFSVIVSSMLPLLGIMGGLK